MRRPDHLPFTWYALAAGTVLAAAALGLWAWRFHRRLEGELARAARAQSEVLARDFGEEFSVRHAAASDVLFGGLADDIVAWPVDAMDSLLAHARREEACRCRPAYGARGAFHWTSDRPGELRTVDIAAPDIEALRREVAQRAELIPTFGSAILLIKSDTEGHERFGLGLFQRFPGRPLRALGIVGDEAHPWTGFVEPIVDKVGRARLGDRHADLVAWRVVRPNGDTLFAAGTLDPQQPIVRSRFLRRQFLSDSQPQDVSFLSEARGHTPMAGSTPDPRTAPWVVIAQVSPQAMEALLYGSDRVGREVILALVAFAVILAGAMIAVARRLVRQVTEREAFATAMAHDLRTPLTQILLHAESLQLGRAVEGTRREAARVIAREARRLVHLVENALTFVRRKDTPPRLAFASLDPVRVVQDVLASFEPTLARADVRVRTDLSAGLLISVDPESLVQVLGNVLDNAVRFGPTGQQITMAVRAEADAVSITVEDEGPGVPSEEREEVFQPFVRGRSSGGTGIGLAVARQLVELMNGRIEFRDRHNTRGACVAILFPAQRGPAPA